MAWLQPPGNQDVSSGNTSTGTAGALINPWTATSVRAICVFLHDTDPGTIVTPAEWGTVTQIQSVETPAYITTIVAEEDFVAADFGTVYDFSWDNDIRWVGSMHAIFTEIEAGGTAVIEPTLEDFQHGTGGPASWNLPDMTAVPIVTGLTGGYGEHWMSPRGYVRTAGFGTVATAAPIGNWTRFGGGGAAAGRVTLDANWWEPSDATPENVGERGLEWNSTASGVGVEQLIRVGVVYPPDPAPLTTTYSYALQSRRIEARELPHQVTSRMFRDRD